MILPCPLASFAALAPGAWALRCGPLRLTAAELEQRVRAAGRGLSQGGLQPGDRIGLLADPGPDAAALLFAAARARLLVALFHPRLTAAEIEPLKARAQLQATFADPQLAARLPGSRMLPELLAQGWAPALGGEPAGPPATWDGAAPVVAVFTSGSEGPPKAALLSCGALLASSRAGNEVLGLGPGDLVYSPLPFAHVGGLAPLVRAALAGAEVWVEPRWDPQAALAAIEAGATHASVVARTLAQLLDAAERRPGSLPGRLRAVLVGGGPVPASILARARVRGLPALRTYGLTEAASQVCTERPGEADGESCGPPLPGLSLRIADEEGRPLPAGAAGRIEVSGPTLFSGYLDAPDRSAAALAAGWLRTGDLGRLDARGRLVPLGRRDDRVTTGGEKVSPEEVEAALCSDERVAEAVVFGRPDPMWGERLEAAVVLRAHTLIPSADELILPLRARLAGFKLPRAIHVVESLPTTSSGKVDRRAVRHRFVRPGE